MKELITASIVVSIIIGLTMQLVDIADSTSKKVVKYADDMNNAIDCAFKGVDIYVCSPDLSSTDFRPELNQTKEIADKMSALGQNITGIGY